MKKYEGSDPPKEFTYWLCQLLLTLAVILAEQRSHPFEYFSN